MIRADTVLKAAQVMPHVEYPGRAAVEKLATPLASRIAGHTVQRLFGFWFMFHAYNGEYKRMIAEGRMTKRSIVRQRGEFRALFGVDVSELYPEIGAKLREPQKVMAGGK